MHELGLIGLDFASIELSAALLLPESLARRYRALPVRFLHDGWKKSAASPAKR